MVTELPPLGSRGFTPLDLATLPVLPPGFVWARPSYGNNFNTDDRVEIVVGNQRVASIEPLAKRDGWVACVGCHREHLKGRHHIWVTRFDRGIDYVVGWVARYALAIADEASARHDSLLSRHMHRVPYERTDAPGSSQQHPGPRAPGPEVAGTAP